MSDLVLFDDRGVLEIEGPDAVAFLHHLVTNDIAGLAPGAARFAALLTPQGKIISDFFVYRVADRNALRLILDVPKPLVAEVAARLRRYRLRAQVEIRERPDTRCWAALGEPPMVSSDDLAILAAAPDPRRADLGWRMVRETGQSWDAASRDVYERRRVAAGVPDGLIDFVYGDTYPHEANVDRLDGLDFKKGCYVGQEVVARMHYRTVVKKRVTPFAARGPMPAPNVPIRAAEVEIGRVGSSADGRGLALVRLDRLEEVHARGARAEAAGVILDFEPADVRADAS